MNGSQLLPAGLCLPELAFDGHPGLSARIGHDVDPGQAVALELADDDLRLQEIAGEFLAEPLAVEGVDLGDRRPGGLAGGLADDLVHLSSRQERPIEPGSVLGGNGGGQGQAAEQDHCQSLGHAILLSGRVARFPTYRIWR
jgi:hypothetical protein